MKIINLRNVLTITSLFIFFLCITFVLSNSMSFGLLKKESKIKKEEIADTKISYSNNNESANKSVFFEGWIKYLHYNEAEKNKSKAFYKNLFFKQQNANPQIKNNDIKDKVLFE